MSIHPGALGPLWGSVLAAVVCYLLGGLDTAFFLGKAKGVDVRDYGSGNLGATNTMRVLGVGPGLIALFCDAAKGALCAALGLWLGGTIGMLLAATAAIVGHNWPPFFHFRGGKGVATSLGIVLFVSPVNGLAALVVALIVIAISRYVSLGSISGMCAYLILLALCCFLFPTKPLLLVTLSWYHVAFAALWAGLMFWQHRENIRRLLKGEERRFSFRSAGSVR